MPAPLQDALVDAFFANLDQLPADHNGPTGRIRSLANAQTQHYTHASQFNPAKISLEPRKGFASLPQTVRDVNGVTIPAEWNTSSLLDTISDQLVAIDERVPRVFNGYDAWTEYSDALVLTNKLREDSLVGGYGISTTPDQCTLGHVQAVAYTQHPLGDTWEIWLGFREVPGSLDGQQRRASPLQGPWIAPPVKIESESVPSVAHVLTDGARFFLIWNTDLGSPTFNIWAFNAQGKFLAATAVPKLDPRSPGWWDVTVDRFDPTKMILVQPAGDTTDPTVDVHVRFSRFLWNGSGISVTSNTDATIVCNGWCNWLENRRDLDSYLVTSGPGETDQTLRAYQVSGLAQTDEWDIDDITPTIDAITGYVPNEDIAIAIAPSDTAAIEVDTGNVALTLHNANFTMADVGSTLTVAFAAPNSLYSGTYTIATVLSSTQVVTATPWPGGTFTAPASGTATLRPEPTIYAVVGELETASVTGPQYDPQMRRIVTYEVTHAGAAIVRQSASQALVSKSTVIGDDWFDVTFYQSGSGINSQADALTPSVTAGDWFSGSAKQTVSVSTGSGFGGPNQTFIVPTASVAPFPINTTQSSSGPQTIASPDQVEYLLAPAGLPWLAEGTPCLKWTIAACVSGTNIFGGRLHIVGTGSPGVDFTWDIYGPGGSGIYYTTTTNTNGGSLAGLTAPVTLTTGTAECVSMTQYSVPNLGDKYDSGTVDILVAGNVIISGNPTSNNNGTKVVQRAFAGDPAAPYFMRVPCIWITTSTGSPESSSASGFTLVTDIANPNLWTFPGSVFGTPLIGGSLLVSDDVQFPENNSGAVNGGIGYDITDVNNDAIETDGGDTGTTRAQVFVSPFPTIVAALGDKQPYSFFIQALAPELAINAFRFRGATLQLTSDTPIAQAGLYKIIDVGPDLDGTLYCERVVQADDIPAYDLRVDHDSIAIFLPIASLAPFQPTYFMTPILGKRSTIGMFDRLNAYNNWRIDGVNTLDGHLTHVSDVDGVLQFVAPTTQERVTQANGNQQLVQASIVGIKAWSVSTEYGQAVDTLIPGCQAVDFEGDSFPEDGFALAAESPWLVSQGEADPGQLGLTPKATYVYTVVIESQDRAGKRVSSPPSPPLIVGPLAGDNNSIMLGGDLPVPWNAVPGTLYADTYGVTNRLPITISIYRSSIRNGIQTTTQYKITTDLQPNALAPLSDNNASGFTFANGQWTYKDENPDLVIQVNEPCYANVAFPRFGAPAFTDGEFWNDRYWIIDSAGGIPFSSPITDGQRPSWFPGWRIAPPAGDRAVNVRSLQQFLIVECEKGAYYLPATQLPSVVLTEAGQVTIPSLIPLPFTNGSTGQAITTPAGVMYASTALGVWNVTRSLTNDPVSLNAVDTFAALAGKIRGFAIDRDQRMIIALDSTVMVYDFVSGLWSEWFPPVQQPKQVATYNGRFAMRCGEFVLVQTDDPFDEVDGVLLPIDWQVVLAGLSFSSVRAFVRLRRMQIVGKYRGIHRQTVTFGYPDDFPDDPTVCPTLTPVASTPYLIEAIPGHGRASQFDVTIDIDHDGEEVPGDSCSLEVLSCKIGVQPGQRQVTPGQRV